jgi:ATP-dependent DNA helicase PIF1
MSSVEKKIKDAISKLSLSETQKEAVAIVCQSKNVFITGPGGSGKSHVLKILAALAKMKGKKTATTAPTGLAASLIDGTTMHSFFGVNPSLCSKKTAIEIYHILVRTKSLALKRIKELNLLFIDEFGMIDANYLSKMSDLCQIIRGCSTRSFGGIQVVSFGDFLQLPPIGCTKYIFESEMWKKMRLTTVILKENYRQSSDTKFFNMLNEVRTGRISEETDQEFSKRQISKMTVRTLKREIFLANGNHERAQSILEESDDDSLDSFDDHEKSSLLGDCVHIYVTNESARKRNMIMYSKLKSKREKIYKATIGAPKGAFDSLIAYETLHLKIGCKVLLITNLMEPEFLCNGTRGVVIDFNASNDDPVVMFTKGGRDITVVLERHIWKNEVKRFDGSVTEHTFHQYPIVHAWAITVCKSQGMSLLIAYVSTNMMSRFPGNAYTAFSRVKTVHGLIIDNWHKSVVNVSKTVLDFYDNPVYYDGIKKIESDIKNKEPLLVN